jgi:SAM-dependent methyltransferase
MDYNMKTMKNDGLLSPLLRYWRAAKVGGYLKRLKNKRVLDLGCGDASTLAFLNETNQYVGVDRDLDYVSEEKRRLKQAQFLQADLNTEMKKIKGTFDAILFLAVLEHLDLTKSLKENIVAKMKKGGLLYVATPHPLAKKIHDAGSRLSLFNRIDNKEHKNMFDKKRLSLFFKDLELVSYRKFEFGLNQLFVFKRNF